MNKPILLLLLVFLQAGLLAYPYELRGINYKSDSLPVPEVNLLYDGKPITAELFESLSLRQTQLIPIQIEMEIPKTFYDSLPNLVLTAELVSVVFAINDTAPISSCDFKGPVVLIMLQWSFGEPVKKGDLIGFKIHYKYNLKGKNLGSGEVTKYIKF